MKRMWWRLSDRCIEASVKEKTVAEGGKEIMNRRSLSSLLVMGAFSVLAQTEFTLDFSKRGQTIEHIGASTGMHGDYISKHWNSETVDQIAELLFSREKGIGLSSFRIQIGGGAEGLESGIRSPWRRTECFLRPDGTYDWNHDRGVLYWRKKAELYDLPVVIGYLNSPPVNFTESGYTFKTEKSFTSNLKPEHYGAYAEFLTKVAGHFQSLDLPFTHISPVNEPQWFWDGVPGKAKQEGTPWTNEQIARLIRLIDTEFCKVRIGARLLIPEAAEYQALYSPLPKRDFAEASDQINAFWKAGGSDYVGNLKTLEQAVAGHAYFSDSSVSKIIRTRRMVKEAVGSVPDLRFWQTEYSLLGDGWAGGLPPETVDEMTAALLLARNIHSDFTLADATAWQWWSSTEPRMGRVPRYCLIECDAHGAEQFRATKLLWALGHYSRFVRPGMVRVEVESDQSIEEGLQDVMASAYYDEPRNRWVMVLINFSEQEREVCYQSRMLPMSEKRWLTAGILTHKGTDFQRFDVKDAQVAMPPKSMVTLVSWVSR
jgi:O-glycosyl hydrolase